VRWRRCGGSSRRKELSSGAASSQGLVHRVKFQLPSYKGCEAPCGCSLEAAAERTGPDQLEDLDGLRQPLHGNGPQSGHLHQSLYEPEGVGRQEGTPRMRQLFHMGSQMHRLTNGRVIHVQIIADRAHHHLTGIEPDPHLHGETLGAAHVLGIGPDRRVHGQRGVTRPHGMVLMRNGGAKQRHNTIAHDLIHRAIMRSNTGSSSWRASSDRGQLKVPSSP